MSVKTLLPGSLPRPRWLVVAAVLAAVAVVGWLALGPQLGQVAHDPVALRDSADSGAPDGTAGEAPEPGGERFVDSTAEGEGAARDGGAGSDGGADRPARPVESDSGLGDLEAASRDRRLIREGSMTVEYADTFEAAYRRIAELARQHDGGVLELESSTDNEGITRGSITVEAPVGDYDALLDAVGDVGQVMRRDVRTEDVTEEYVDLRSRLRHLERTEQFFLDLFEKGETVDDAIRIRDRLDSVQQRIEKIEGRLRQLEQRTEMSRLTVELVPEGGASDGTPPAVAGFADYWHDAQQAFVGVAGTLLVVAVGGAPLALAGAVGLAVAVALVRAWRSANAAGAE